LGKSRAAPKSIRLIVFVASLYKKLPQLGSVCIKRTPPRLENTTKSDFNNEKYEAAKHNRK
jgi:hypothetical protein